MAIFGGVVLVVAVLFLLGIALVVSGIRGRLVSGAPHCRACRFDLTGGAGRCPECGADLSRPRAIREGLRVPRRRSLAFGVACLLLSCGAVGAIVFANARSFNWNTIKPVGLLVRELNSLSPRTSDAAIVELHSRLSAGKLSAERTNAIIAMAISRQADTAAGWSSPWGSFLNDSFSAKLLNSTQVESFARHSPSIQGLIRPRIAAGEPTSLNVRVSANRIGDPSPLRVSLRHVESRVGGTVIAKGGGGASSMGLSVGGWSTIGQQVTLPGPAGEREVTTKWAVEVHTSEEQPPLATWEETFTLDVTVLPEDTSTVEIVQDESLREQIEKSLTIRQCAVRRYDPNLHGSGTVNLQGSPVPLAFDVVWADPAGTREWLVGDVSFTGSGGAGYGFGADLPNDFDLTTIDVVLRPSAKAAAKTTDIFRIWGGEVRVRGIKLSPP